MLITFKRYLMFDKTWKNIDWQFIIHMKHRLYLFNWDNVIL